MRPRGGTNLAAKAAGVALLAGSTIELQPRDHALAQARIDLPAQPGERQCG
jgi:hypothetical protein